MSRSMPAASSKAAYKNVALPWRESKADSADERPSGERLSSACVTSECSTRALSSSLVMPSVALAAAARISGVTRTASAASCARCVAISSRLLSITNSTDGRIHSGGGEPGSSSTRGRSCVSNTCTTRSPSSIVLCSPSKLRSTMRSASDLGIDTT
jgi:hypothetical protein